MWSPRRKPLRSTSIMLTQICQCDGRLQSLGQRTSFELSDLSPTPGFALSRSSSITHATTKSQLFERFFGCRVHFGRRDNSLTFSRTQLNLPIATADERLHGLL